MEETLVETWRKIILGDKKSWVLFKHGTCVILMQPGPDLTQQALDLLKEWGPVATATSSADFGVIYLDKAPGWVVTCHHSDILTYVGPAEFEKEDPAEVLIGLLGRSFRDQDAAELEVIHVEDKR